MVKMSTFSRRANNLSTIKIIKKKKDDQPYKVSEQTKPIYSYKQSFI